MFQRIAMGWQLTKQSIHVLKMDKELLLFPVLSGISCLLVLASFAVPIFLAGGFEGMEENRENVAQNALAAIEGIFYTHLFAFDSAKLFGGIEWLGEKPLQPSGSIDDVVIICRQLLQPQHGNDILEFFIVSQSFAYVLRQFVVPFADNARCGHF